MVKFMRIRGTGDYSNLERGDSARVYGRIMYFHGVDQQTGLPEFVDMAHDPRFLAVQKPINAVFRRILGGIKRAEKYSSKHFSELDEGYAEYFKTAQIGGFVRKTG